MIYLERIFHRGIDLKPTNLFTIGEENPIGIKIHIDFILLPCKLFGHRRLASFNGSLVGRINNAYLTLP